jgi:hypothetical protein
MRGDHFHLLLFLLFILPRGGGAKRREIGSLLEEGEETSLFDQKCDGTNEDAGI